MLPLIIFYSDRIGLKIFSFVAIGGAYAAIIYYALQPTEGFSGQWTNSFVQFQFFAVGMLTSLYLKGTEPKMNPILRWLLFIFGIGCWLFSSIVCEVNADAPHMASVTQSVTGWMLILLGVVAMFFALYGAEAKYMPRGLVYLGRISYGLYIFHITVYWIVFEIFKSELANLSQAMNLSAWKNSIGFVIAFLLTVALANLSYRFLEKPFLKWKNRYTRIPSRD